MGMVFPGLVISFPCDGAVLTPMDGHWKEGRFQIFLEGSASCPGIIRLNEDRLFLERGPFRIPLDLNDHRSDFRIQWESSFGTEGKPLRLLWDRSIVKRYRFSVDDNILFLRDIARNPIQNIFQHPYLAFWRKMHNRYGSKIQLNIYYQDSEFNLSQISQRYRKQWENNREWMRITFHARSDQPSRPYLTSDYNKMEKDYTLVTREIERWAGPSLLSPFTTIHWAEATRESCRALRDQGVRGLVGYFRFRDGHTYCSYYLNPDIVRHLEGRDAWMDCDEDILFVKHDMVINEIPLGKIREKLNILGSHPHQGNILEFMVHEQYFRKDLPVFYQPNIEEKVELAIRWASERGYRPAFYEEGFLGAVQ